MALDSIYLPKLNMLTPTLESTLLKAVEEAGELARAVLKFLPYQDRPASTEKDRLTVERLLAEVAEELLDVAQTCVTMIFVMEDSGGFQADVLIDAHLDKLVAKGYRYDRSQAYHITTHDRFKFLNLPRLELDQVTLLTTVCKIQEELGELTQFLGKRAGASGEQRAFAADIVMQGCALELLDVAQCCFTMMYILAEKHGVDILALLDKHIAKLRLKGYFA
ncbi:MAG: MazG nucleotide pyrophosphohydrolase domain-containing protein [Negativicutes bacterium]|nr:MazG nucleotide pyrophosphohydrolase domain-containing protein [Negativicutes bacterium]